MAVFRPDGPCRVERVSPDNYLGRNESQWNLKGLLRLGAEWAESVGPVIIGVDVALGVPSAYLKSWNHDKCDGSQAENFTDWLCSVPKALLRKKTKSSTRCYTRPVEWSVGDPFFNLTKNPEPKGDHPGVFTELVKSVNRDGHNLLYRRVDQSTGAQPLWALNKGGSVGSGTRDFWKDLRKELKRPERTFRVWPFKHSDVNPMESQGITLAETYPALAYAVALASTLAPPPSRLVQIRKTDGKKKNRRQEVCRLVKANSWFKDTSWDAPHKLNDALEGAHRNEDHFDSILTALAVIRCLRQQPERLFGRVDPIAEGGMVDPIAEGGMLLAAAVKPPPAKSYENWMKTHGPGLSGSVIL